MAEKRKLDFFLLRYVPDAVKEEFVNIGLVMIEASGNGGGFADLRFTRDWRRVLCLDPQADIEVLQAIERDIRKQVVEVRNCESVMQKLNDSFSNLIQLSKSKGCFTEDPTMEIEKMAGMYLEAARAGGAHAVSGRRMILAKMREAWERAGVEKFLNPVPVAQYTRAGDPFKFDFGYRVGGEIKLFHAVSLKASVDAAVMLAARYPEIGKGMAKAEDAVRPFLTAVVDDGLDRSKDEIGFALAMMEENKIKVAAVAEMPGIAERVRVELRV
jgi:hypothetical protein